MRKRKILNRMKSVGVMLFVLVLMLASVIKIKADSVQIISYEGIKLYVRERMIDSNLELKIGTEVDSNLEIESITYNDDTFFFEDNIVTFKIIMENILPLELNLDRTVTMDSKSINRHEIFQFKTKLMDEYALNQDVIEDYKSEDSRIVKVLDALPDLDKIDTLIEDDEYININQESGQIEVLKFESLNESSNRVGAQVKTGSKISSGVNFYWGANESFAWQFPGGFSEISVNNIVAYCLEPSIMLTETNGATSTRIRDLSKIRIMDGRLYTTLSKKQIERIELIASYGFQYLGHNSKAYRWATQVMVFESIGWVFETHGTPNVDKEIKEIERLIAQHDRKPSWNGMTLSFSPGKVVDLSDKLLEGYTVNFTNTKNVDIIRFNGHTLEVKPLNDNAVLELNKISQSSIGDSIVFSDGASQKVGNLKIPKELMINVRFKVKPGTINVTKFDGDGIKYPDVEFEISSNKKDIIDTITTNALGEATLSNLKPGVYYIREKSVPSPLLIDTKWYQFSIESDKKTEYRAVNAKVTGEIHLLKTDENDNPLSNVTFELRDENNTLINSLTTNKGGRLDIENLKLGVYSLIETKVDAPYVIEENPTIIELKYVDFNTPVVNQNLHITNKSAKGKISIHKISNEDTNIVGAIFEIRDEKMNLIDRLITQNDGTALSKELQLGKYLVIETFVPKPFVLDTKEYEVNLYYENQNTEIVVETLTLINYPQKVELEVLKKEDTSDPIFTEKHGQELPGTEFGLYTVDNNELTLVEKGETDTNGKLIFKDLGFGTYLLRELNPSPGYQSHLQDIIFDLDFDELAFDQATVYKQVIVENSPLFGKAHLIKENDERQRLEGVEFDLYTIDNRKVTSLTSNHSGEIETPMLRYGKYYLQETKAHPGHEMSTDKIYFTIQSSTETLSLNAINKIHRANLKILKVDSVTKEPLSGAHFKIKNKETGKFISYVETVDNSAVIKDEWISDENGLISLSSPLSYGDYSLVETKAPDGYLIGRDISFSIDESQNYEIDTTTRTLKITVENVKKRYKIEIHKIDATNNSPVPGVRFALFSKDSINLGDLENNIERSYDRNNNLIGVSFNNEIVADLVGVTDGDGNLAFNDLYLDEYYIVETDAPYGYTLNRDIAIVSQRDLIMKEDFEPFILNLRNNRSSFKVIASKRDRFSNDKLMNKDFILELYDSKGKKVLLSKFENGEHIWIVDALETYHLKELKAPKGYKLSNETVTIDTSIETAGIYEVDFFNDVLFEDVLPYTGSSSLETIVSCMLSFGVVLTFLGYIYHKKSD